MGEHPNAAAHDLPLLALVASGDRRYREYIVRSVASRYRLWLLDAHESTWQRPYVAGSSLIDVRDPHALIAAARAIPREHGPLAGVFCYDEWTIQAAAVLAQTLNLPASPPAAVAVCRDKAATRQRLADAGLPQPQSFPVGSLDQAATAADKIGYPVVVKARALAGSIGVVRVDTASDLRTAYTAAAAAGVPGVRRGDHDVLVEEYLDGPRSASTARWSTAPSRPSRSLGRPSSSTRTSRKPRTSWTPPIHCCTTPNCANTSPPRTGPSDSGTA